LPDRLRPPRVDAIATFSAAPKRSLEAVFQISDHGSVRRPKLSRHSF
jgi:hypothetical protein